MNPGREAKIQRVLNFRQPDLAVVMENVNDPHNISAVMRTCDAIGIQHIYILNTIIHPHAKFGIKSSASASKWLTIHQYDNTEKCMTDLKSRYGHIYATHLGVESKSLYELNLTQSAVLVFGNEHSGVSDECLTYCDGNFIIPQVGMVQSLNISVACAVTLYEAMRQRLAAGMYEGNHQLPETERTAIARGWGVYEELR